MSAAKITFPDESTNVNSLVNDSTSGAEAVVGDDNTTQRSLLPRVARGEIEKVNKYPDDNDDKYLIPVYNENNKTDILMRIPVLKNYKSYKPKNHMEAVYKTKGPFKEEVNKMKNLDEFIKKNCKQLVDFTINKLTITGLEKLTMIELYFLSQFLNRWGFPEFETDKVVLRIDNYAGEINQEKITAK